MVTGTPCGRRNRRENQKKRQQVFPNVQVPAEKNSQRHRGNDSKNKSAKNIPEATGNMQKKMFVQQKLPECGGDIAERRNKTSGDKSCSGNHLPQNKNRNQNPEKLRGCKRAEGMTQKKPQFFIK